jgi:uncharacterized protein with GYD domain
MLHMIVNTHHAESCAFRGDEEAKALTTAFDRFGEQAGGRGITVQGAWIKRAAHEFLVLVDAPNAHVIDEGLLASGMVGRTHTRVLAVLPAEDVEVEPEDERR